MARAHCGSDVTFTMLNPLRNVHESDNYICFRKHIYIVGKRLISKIPHCKLQTSWSLLHRVPSSYEWAGVQRTHSFWNKGFNWDHKESIHFIRFYPRPVLAFGYCCWLRLSVCVCGNHLLVRAITCHAFKLESPNLDHKSKTPWLRSLLFWGVIDLELQGQI